MVEYFCSGSVFLSPKPELESLISSSSISSISSIDKFIKVWSWGSHDHLPLWENLKFVSIIYEYDIPYYIISAIYSILENRRIIICGSKIALNCIVTKMD